MGQPHEEGVGEREKKREPHGEVGKRKRENPMGEWGERENPMGIVYIARSNQSNADFPSTSYREYRPARPPAHERKRKDAGPRVWSRNRDGGGRKWREERDVGPREWTRERDMG